jgi:hypothetical protein
MRSGAAGATHPQVIEDMIAELDHMFRDGLPTLTEMGAMFAGIARPGRLLAYDLAGAFDDVPPGHVVKRIDRWLRDQTPATNFAEVWATCADHASELDADALGPDVLGMYGYQRDSRSTVNRRAPGQLADQQHAMFGLKSAIFVTAERRLPRRMEAWAAHTERGRAHGTWPVILQVAVSEPQSVRNVADVVRRYADAFPDAVAEAFT